MQIHKFHEKVNHEQLISYIDDYFKDNKCCGNYPFCFHPKHQTDSQLFSLSHPFIQNLRGAVEQITNKKCIDMICWAYFHNEITQHEFHIHDGFSQDEGFSGEKSFLMYLSDLQENEGTLFIKGDDGTFSLNPKKNTWYIFDGDVTHSPEMFKTKSHRYVIAGQFGLMNNV